MISATGVGEENREHWLKENKGKEKAEVSKLGPETLECQFLECILCQILESHFMCIL